MRRASTSTVSLEIAWSTTAALAQIFFCKNPEHQTPQTLQFKKKIRNPKIPTSPHIQHPNSKSPTDKIPNPQIPNSNNSNSPKATNPKSTNPQSPIPEIFNSKNPKSQMPKSEIPKIHKYTNPQHISWRA